MYSVQPCNGFSCESATLPLVCGVVCSNSTSTQFANASVFNSSGTCSTQCFTGLLPPGTSFVSAPTPAIPFGSSLLPSTTRNCLEGVDCGALIGGICVTTQFYGLGNPPYCTCNGTQFFTYRSLRCVDVEPALTFQIQFNRTLYFTEQLSASTWRPRGTLPSEWTCVFGSCRATAPEVSLFTNHPDALRALMDPVNTRSLPLSLMSWWCRDPKKRATMLNHELSAGGTQGIRPLGEYCVTCSTWCGPHGSCRDPQARAADFACDCLDGWTGARCNDVLEPTPGVSLLWFNGTFWDSASSYLPYRGCTRDSNCGVNEQCYYPVKDPTVGGRCWCRLGYYPSSGTDCSAAPIQKFLGAVLRGEEWRAYDVYFSTRDPRLIWYFDFNQTVLYSAYTTDRVILKGHPGYRINPAHLFVFACSDPSTLFVDTRQINQPDASLHCLGAQAICNGNADPQFSSGRTGRCSCVYPHNGTYCEACIDHSVPPSCELTRAECRLARCSNHGDCSNDTTCVCDSGWVDGSDCSLNATACRLARCSGRGQCVNALTNECVCDVGYYGTDCSMTATQCRAQRCGNFSACTGTVQGCASSSLFRTRLLGVCPMNPLILAPALPSSPPPVTPNSTNSSTNATTTPDLVLPDFPRSNLDPAVLGGVLGGVGAVLVGVMYLVFIRTRPTVF